MSQGYETHSVGNMANNDVVSVYGKLGNQPWIFIGRTEAEAPILWPPDVKSWITGKDPNAVQDWGQGEKGATEDEMVRWHHWLNGHEFEQTQGESEGQGSLTCYSLWGQRESDMTWRLNNMLCCRSIIVKKKKNKKTPRKVGQLWGYQKQGIGGGGTGWRQSKGINVQL